MKKEKGNNKSPEKTNAAKKLELQKKINELQEKINVELQRKGFPPIEN